MRMPEDKLRDIAKHRVSIHAERLGLTDLAFELAICEARSQQEEAKGNADQADRFLDMINIIRYIKEYHDESKLDILYRASKECKSTNDKEVLKQWLETVLKIETDAKSFVDACTKQQKAKDEIIRRSLSTEVDPREESGVPTFSIPYARTHDAMNALLSTQSTKLSLPYVGSESATKIYERARKLELEIAALVENQSENN